MRRYAEDGDIIHAGAFFGDFLPALSRALRPGCKIWAFEPNPENHVAAAVTCRLNDLQNVELSASALGEAYGRTRMRVRCERCALGGSSSIIGAGAPVPSDDVVEVPICRIDDVVPRSRKVSLLQLDVEGFEQPALIGAVQTITTWRPILILETVPTEWCARVLVPLGYRIRGELHDNTILSVIHVRLDDRSLFRRLASKAKAPFRAIARKALGRRRCA